MADGTENEITQIDDLDVPLVVPTHKLDADQYSADDIDGVTEGLFGSGNMAYASLQASQTDAVLSSVVGNIDLGDTAFLSTENPDTARALQAGPEDFTPNNQDAIFTGNEAITDTDRGIETPVVLNGNNGSEGNFASNTVGSLSASQLSSDAGAFSTTGSGLSLQDAINGLNGSDGSAGETPDVPTPNDGADGADGTDCGVGDQNIIVNLGDINLDLGDVTLILDQTFDFLGDTINNLTTSLTDITTILTDITNNLDLTEILNVVNDLTVNLENIIQITLTEITNITENITNLVENLVDLNDLNIILDLDLLGDDVLDVNVPLGNVLDTDIDLDVDLGSSVDLLNNVVGLTGLDVLSDSLAELGGTIAVLQDAIDQVTTIVSDVNLNAPADTVVQVVDALGGLSDTLSGLTDEVDDAVGGILDEIGLGDEITDPLDDVGDELSGAVDGILGGDGGDLSDVLDEIDNLAEGLGLDGLGLGGDGGTGEGDGLLSDTVDPVVDDVTNVLDDLTGGATEDLGETVDDTVDAVTDLADNLTGGLTDGLLGERNDSGEGADTDVSVDLGLGGEDAPIIDEVVDVALDPIEDIVGDVDLGVDTTLLGDGETSNGSGDSDVTVETGIDLVDNAITDLGVDIPLDPIEEVVGDIDLDVDLAANLLGDVADPLMDGEAGGSGEDTLAAEVGDVLSDTVGGLLGSGGDGADDGEDGLLSDTLDPVVDDVTNALDDLTGGATEDLGETVDDTVDAVTDLADNLTGGLFGGLGLGDDDVSLDDAQDTVDQIAGDLDLNIDDAIDLLSTNSSDSDDGSNLGDDVSWTESTITDGGGLFGDIINGTDGLGDALPDPAGTVAEGIGVLDVEPELDVGSIGGLFG